ncbi:MAG: alpha/beta hydrolase, partial [Bacteroidota bacterium]
MTQKIKPVPGDLQSYIYRKVNDTADLKLAVHYPSQFDKKQKQPAIVFFFGGGWKGGNRSQFLKQAEHYAEKGWVAIRADYRIANTHGSTPFDAVM